MNNQQLLKSSIESLKQIQLEMHDGMDSSKQIELVRVIQQLEYCSKNESSVSPTYLLEVIGKVIAWVPAVERLLKLFGE